MSDNAEIQFETAVARYIERLIPHDEEQNPIPWCPTPGMLVARATERLAQASVAIGDYEAGEEEERAKLVQVGVFFIGAATVAINAIPHIHPGGDEAEPTEFKDELLLELDRQVAEIVHAGTFYEDADPDDWLRRTLALLAGACQSLCEREHALRPLVGAREWDDEDFTDWDWPDACARDAELRDDEHRTAIADSLFQMAVMASAAGSALAVED